MDSQSKIPIEAVQSMSTDQLLILVVQSLNQQSQQLEGIQSTMRTYIEILESKVTRDEFLGHCKKDDDKNSKDDLRFRKLEDAIMVWGSQGKAGLTIGKWFWVGLLGLLNILQFVTIAFQTGQDA